MSQEHWNPVAFPDGCLSSQLTNSEETTSQRKKDSGTMVRSFLMWTGFWRSYVRFLLDITSNLISSHATPSDRLVHPKHKKSRDRMNNLVDAVQYTAVLSDKQRRETKQTLHKCMAQHRRANTTWMDSAVRLYLKDSGCTNAYHPCTMVSRYLCLEGFRPANLLWPTPPFITTQLTSTPLHRWFQSISMKTLRHRTTITLHQPF